MPNRHEILVVHIHSETARLLAARGIKVLYIGRPSRLGNPFVIGKDGDRETVIARYRAWLLDRLAKNDMQIRDALNQIEAEARKGEVALACYCAPRACHGDVIKELLDARV